jgi:hypothetical protein
MSDANRFTIVCPCCEATLTVDADTGTLLSHEEKHKALGSFEDMVKDLDKQKQTREQIFAQEMSSHKDRSRLYGRKISGSQKESRERHEDLSQSAGFGLRADSKWNGGIG